jgi:hypothetical protein
MKYIYYALTIIFSNIAIAEEDPDKLVKLRERWQEAKEKAIKPIDIKYQKALVKLKNNYMSKGDLKSAVAIDEEIKRSSSIQLKSINKSNQGAVISKKSIQSAILPLQNTSPIYSNRDYKWGTIPIELVGYSYSQGTMRSLKDIEFKVKTSGIIYCAFSTHNDLHKDKMKSLIANGWKKCSFSMTNTDSYLVLSKHFNKGNASVQWVHPHGGSLLIFKSAE